ncbi:MAG: dihydrofolate reductase [Taibaiella sp.]|nr:dihydrofolate reductase [Taibaiella sp.]
MDAQNGIGKNGVLPWQLSADLKHFRKVTSDTDRPGVRNVVVMGRRTWVSIPHKFRPLSNRINVILSRDPNFTAPDDVIVARSLDEIPHQLKLSGSDYGAIYVIGGQQVYEAALAKARCQRLYVTRVNGDFECDAFFPTLPQQYRLISSGSPQTENGIGYSFLVYEYQG